MKRLIAIAALLLSTAPAQALPHHHTIVNRDGSAFTCRFRANTTHCYKSSVRTRHKALTVVKTCSQKAKAQGIHPMNHAWHRQCRDTVLSSLNY